MQTKFTIAMVVILMAAAFAGVVAMDDEADAATTYTVSVDAVDKEGVAEYSDWGITEFSNKAFGNSLTVVDGKLTGTVVKAPVYSGTETALKDVTLVDKMWYSATKGTTDAPHEAYIFMISITGLTPGVSVVWEPSIKGSDVFELKGVKADSNGTVNILFKSFGGEDAIKEFEFILSGNVTYAEGTSKVDNMTEEAFKSYNKEKIEFDIEYLGTPIEVRYSIGDYTCIQKTNEGKMYTLASLEALNATAPSGNKFIGWTDGTNTYSVGTVIVFGANTAKEFTAVFEALPEAVITFVDGTSTLKSINVSDLSEKTVPSVEKTGYTFDGWFMGDVKVDPLIYTFEESVTLVAQWTPINCYVTFVAGDFVKTVPVLYGDRVQAPALPDGFEKWNFDFSVVITDDLTIAAIEKAPEKPTGLADPTIKMALVVVGLFVCVLLAVIILKREDIRAGMVRKLSKTEEDKKE